MRQQHFGGMQRNKQKEEMGNGKKDKKRSRKINRLSLQTNLSIPVMKAAVMRMKAMLFSTLVTLRQN